MISVSNNTLMLPMLIVICIFQRGILPVGQNRVSSSVSELMIPLNMNNSLVYQIFNLINQIQWNNKTEVTSVKLVVFKWEKLFDILT